MFMVKKKTIHKCIQAHFLNWGQKRRKEDQEWWLWCLLVTRRCECVPRLWSRLSSGLPHIPRPRHTRPCTLRYKFVTLRLENRIGGTVIAVMDQISIKTPNPKCRLCWCLTEFTDWRYSQSCWYFRPLSLLSTSAPLSFSLVHLPPFPCVNKYRGTCIKFIQFLTGRGSGSSDR